MAQVRIPTYWAHLSFFILGFHWWSLLTSFRKKNKEFQTALMTSLKYIYIYIYIYIILYYIYINIILYKYIYYIYCTYTYIYVYIYIYIYIYMYYRLWRRYINNENLSFKKYDALSFIVFVYTYTLGFYSYIYIYIYRYI